MAMTFDRKAEAEAEERVRQLAVKFPFVTVSLEDARAIEMVLKALNFHRCHAMQLASELHAK